MDHGSHIYTALSSALLLDYDWDGSGGLPLRSDVLDTAKAFCGDANILEDLDDFLPEPAVTINGNGTIELAYEQEGRELFVTIQCQGVFTYIRLYEDEQTSVEGVIRLDYTDTDFSPDDFVELLELYRWLAWG